MKNKSEEYKNGFYAGKNGTNTSNSSYTNFTTKEKKDQWQLGYKNGQRAKKRADKQPFMIGGVEYEALVIDFKPGKLC